MTGSDRWEWPDELDALVAAPASHHLVFENDDVRILDTRIGPRELSPLHTHRWPAVLYVLSRGEVVRRDEAGALLDDTRVSASVPDPGTAIRVGPRAPHTVENVGLSEIRLLNIELKHPRSPRPGRDDPIGGDSTSEAWESPESLDALTAAPGFHIAVFENDDVRVLDTMIGPGEVTPAHTHRWPAVLYVLSAGHVVRRDHRGVLLVDTRTSGTEQEAGTTFRVEPMPPHTVENVDRSEIRLLNIELKR